MGKDNDIPDAPDYSDLTDIVKVISEYAQGLSAEQQDWAEDAYADNKGVSDQIIDMALGEMDKQIADADRSREEYWNIYAPLGEQLAAEAESYSSPERMEYEAGKAEADVAAQFEQARRTATEKLETYGVDPSQTRQGAMDLGTRVAEAAAQASAGNQARWKTEEYGDKLRQDAINLGQGISDNVTQSEAGASTSGTQATNTGLATTASGAETMGTGESWANTALGGTTGWGNLLNQNFNQELSSSEAKAEANSGWGEILGTVAGTAMGAWFDEGGVIPDENGQYLDPSMSPSGGQITDDIPAEIDGSQPAQLNAGEFVIPEDVVSWLGEKGIQQLIMKARKEMAGGDKTRPAQPTEGPPPSYQGAGIPEPRGAV